MVSTEAIINQRRMKGDINGSGGLDVGDAQRMQMFLAERDELRVWDQPINDVAGGDDILTIADVLFVLDVAARIRSQPVVLNRSRDSQRVRLLSLHPDSMVAPVERARLRALSPVQKPGELLTIGVALEGITNTASAAEFSLQYPAAALRLESAENLVPGEIIPVKGAGSVEAVWNVVPSNNYAQQEGLVHFAASSSEPFTAKDGMLAKLTFRIQPAFLQRHHWSLDLVEATITSNGYELRRLALDQLLLSGGSPSEIRLSNLRLCRWSPFVLNACASRASLSAGAVDRLDQLE